MDEINHCIFYYFLNFKEINLERKVKSEQAAMLWRDKHSLQRCPGNCWDLIQEKQNVFLSGITAIHDLLRNFSSVIWKNITTSLACINFTMCFSSLSWKCSCSVCNMVLHATCRIPKANAFKASLFPSENFQKLNPQFFNEKISWSQWCND